jgi:hypothetical protein
LICSELQECLNADEFEITEVYRFEGESNPSDEAVIYVIESKDGKLKGTLVSAYGPYSESMSEDLIKKLSMHRPSDGETS